MPQDPILEAVDESHHHGYTALTFSEYVPPAGQYDESGNLISLSHDPLRYWDDWAKREVMRVIDSKVPAYPGWFASADGQNKLVLISLRTLMGTERFYAINLRTHELSDRNIIEACGQICERYRLPRDRMDIAAFLRARQLHSKLLYRWAKVPE